MAGTRSILVNIVLPLLLASAVFIARRAPFMMVTTAPTKPWADGPIRLVTTLQHEQTVRMDLFGSGATHMALLHNSILRGFNTVYRQAPHVKDEDKADFVNYALTWHKFVKTHHDDEEQELFAKIEELLKDRTVFEQTHKEHEAFLSGLSNFQSYLGSLFNRTSASSFSATELLRIMDSFREPFESHFHSEISTLAALAEHPNCPEENTPEHADALKTFKYWGKTTVSKFGVTDVVPIFLLNLDRTAERGKWANWPPMPAPIRWGLINIAGSWHSGWWRFAACDASGKPKELHAVQG